MTRWLLLPALLLLAACEPPPRAEHAKIGEEIGLLHVIDAKTGYCIEVEWNGLNYQYGRVLFRRVEMKECVR